MIAFVLVLVVALAGCAKRPATTAAVAPAPTGTGATTGSMATTPPSATMQPTQPGRPGTATTPPPAAMQPGQPGSGTGTGTAPGTGTGTGTGPGTGTGTAPGGAGTGATAARPPEARPQPREFVADPNLKDVFFDFDKYDIRPEDAKTLDANANWLKSNPNQLVLIEGHCDERGTNEYNLALGERRAKAAMNYLVSQGVQASRITIISYGEERPTCADKTESCWARNRRAHFLVKAR
jgi:peptidoglycan-associated lipoprotein